MPHFVVKINKRVVEVPNLCSTYGLKIRKTELCAVVKLVHIALDIERCALGVYVDVTAHITLDGNGAIRAADVDVTTHIAFNGKCACFFTYK